MSPAWFCVGVLAAVAVSAGAPADELTLEECVGIAARQATTVLDEETQYRLRGSEVLQSYGQFLPSLDASVTYGYQAGRTLLTFQGATSLDQRFRQAGWRVASTLNLFNGLSDLYGLKASMARRSAELFSLDWARLQIALDVTQTYLQLVLDRLLVEIARRNLEASRLRLKLIQGQTEVGSAAPPDLYRQEAQTSADSLSVTDYETRAYDDQLLLVRKLRIDPGVAHAFKQPDLEAAPSALAREPLERLVEDALGARPDLLAAQARLDATTWSLSAARGGYWPTLGLTLAATSSGTYLTRDYVNGVDALTFSQTPVFSQLGGQTELSATLGVSWNLFGHFLTTLQVSQAVATRAVTEVARDDSRFQLQDDVRSAYANYAAAATQLESARAGLKSAEKSYQVVESMYELGSASIVDVMTAQASLTQARSSEAQARTNLKLQDRTLYYLVGGIDEP